MQMCFSESWLAPGVICALLLAPRADASLHPHLRSGLKVSWKWSTLVVLLPNFTSLLYPAHTRVLFGPIKPSIISASSHLIAKPSQLRGTLGSRMRELQRSSLDPARLLCTYGDNSLNYYENVRAFRTIGRLWSIPIRELVAYTI